MFILLNNNSTNTLDIIKISSVYKAGPTKYFPMGKEGCWFLVKIKDQKKSYI